jgi:hypothetical protein
MKVPALLTFALLIAAGAAQAQSPGYPMGGSSGGPTTNQAQYGGGMGGCGHTAQITDEYGFRYDSEGNRLNGQGCVIAPPVTPPGARAIQNGR